MNAAVMTRSDLSRFFDECISDLDASGAKLFDLAHLLHCIGESTGKTEYHAFVGVFGSFGNELLFSRPLIGLPILPDETRKQYQSRFNEAVKQGKQALSEIKNQLCQNSVSDPVRLLEAISVIAKHDYELGSMRTYLLRGRQSSEETD